ncbi:MAG: hypothetical protein II304_03655 [Bacteroidales bacterium]|nr:hypothetical protein [Bacteroidales bacterium]
MEQNDIFYCYSLRLFHFLSAFGEHCYTSKINSRSKNRYWIFHKSERLDNIIELYNKVKHSI